MKRLFIIAAVLLAAAVPSSAADSSYLKLVGGIGAGYHYLYPKDIQLSAFYKGGMAYRGFAGFKAESGLSAIGDISYFSQGNMSSTAPYGTALTIIPVTASVAYHPLEGSSISPYLGAGIGMYFINENDPDFTYLNVTKFGKHIFAGLDMYIDRGTVLKAELRQAFVDPVSNALYYQANFGGLTASLSIAMEAPLFGKGAPMTSEEAAAAQQRSIASNEHRAIMNRLNDIDAYYYQPRWNSSMYSNPWNTPNIFINNIVQPSQQQIDEQKARAQEAKAVQDQKRQDYLNQKGQLRQDKKETVNPGR